MTLWLQGDSNAPSTVSLWGSMDHAPRTEHLMAWLTAKERELSEAANVEAQKEQVRRERRSRKGDKKHCM